MWLAGGRLLSPVQNLRVRSELPYDPLNIDFWVIQRNDRYKFWIVDDLEGGVAPVDWLRAEFDSNGMLECQD